MPMVGGRLGVREVKGQEIWELGMGEGYLGVVNFLGLVWEAT